MTREDIIRMARIAGVRDDGHRFEFSEYKYLERFAALAFEQGRQEGMKQERALWELSKLGQEIEAQPEQDHFACAGKPIPEQEPFGYFKAEPFGWVDCAETDDDAKALYEAPPRRQPLKDKQILQIYETPELAGFYFDSATNKAIAVARAIEAAHGIGDKP